MIPDGDFVRWPRKLLRQSDLFTGLSCVVRSYNKYIGPVRFRGLNRNAGSCAHLSGTRTGLEGNVLGLFGKRKTAQMLGIDISSTTIKLIELSQSGIAIRSSPLRSRHCPRARSLKRTSTTPKRWPPPCAACIPGRDQKQTGLRRGCRVIGHHKDPADAGGAQ